MYYLRARYYDPDIRRFITEDPIRSGVNWYGYCTGNPISNADPSGLSTQTPIGKLGGLKLPKEKPFPASREGEMKPNSSYTSGVNIVSKAETITIYVYVYFNNPTDNPDMADEQIPGSTMTYRQAAIQGLFQFWNNGAYDGKNVDVVVCDLSDGKSHDTNPGQKAVQINLHNCKGVSHGDFYKQTIDMYIGYEGDDANGKHIIQDDYDASTFSRVFAHEFGHILGISDGYIGNPDDKKINTIYHEFPSLMSQEFVVDHATDIDYAMMMASHNSGQFELFSNHLDILEKYAANYKIESEE